jgi:hypothetical protein
VMGKMSPLMQQADYALYDPASQSFKFSRFEFMSD